MTPVRFWILATLRVLAVLGVLALFGSLIGYPVTSVIVGIALYTSWHLVQLKRLTRWLQRQQADLEEVPDAVGLWGELAAQLRGLVYRDRRRERRFETMLREYQESTAAMPDASVVLNESREILWMNEAASRLLGLDGERDIGQRVDNLIRRPEFASYLTQEDVREPLEIASPINKKTKLAVHIVPFGTGRRLLMFRDNTRLHQLEKVRRKFVANASHELRSPLTVITGYLEQMSDDPEQSAEWDVPLGEMQRQARRMAAIIDDLLELSRLESSARPARLEPVNLAAMLRDVVSEAASHAAEPPKIKLSLESDQRILGEEHELHSVFANLVINAVKYTPSDGRINVRWRVVDGVGELIVEDTGIGIAPEHVIRLTERFYRVDKGRARQAGGTGLGLAIAKYALQRHDATLEVESALGEGSRFTCRFPSRRVGPAAPSEEASRSAVAAAD
ncbi:MAG: phosphate regulon sensor histidine kinase PhoR [Pseudomonadota bacterium]